MSGRFAPPDLLFMGQAEKPERVYLRGLLDKAPYKKVHEPCCGAFAISLLARSVGYEPEDIEASDVCLYSSVIGCLLTGRSLDTLGVTLGGQIVEGPPDLPVDHGAIILWNQLLARLMAKPDVEYWHELIADLTDRRRSHVEEIKSVLSGMVGKLRGIEYTAEDMIKHTLRSSQDGQAITVVMTPTYKKGFERFFNTDELLQWNEPEYEVFDPETGAASILDLTRDRPGLVIVCHKTDPGKAAGYPVHARPLSDGSYMYLLANRPEEVVELMGGVKISPRAKGTELEALEEPALSMEEELPEDAVVEVRRIGKTNAAFYRQLWMHRITTGESALSFAVIVNGQVTGVCGISFDTMQMPLKGAVWADAPMIRYACGAPHQKYRLGRLMTMMCLNKNVLRRVATPGVSLHAEAAERLVTTCYTNYPEAKYLRGIMKLVERAPGTFEKYRLVYGAAPVEESIEDTYKRWLAKEIAYASR